MNRKGNWPEPTEWIFHNGEFVRWHDATTHLLTHTLHYGDGAIEGIRCYQGKRGRAIFRLRDHIERLFRSAELLQMELPYSVDDICNVTVELVRRNDLQSCYVRPMAYRAAGAMGLVPADTPSAVSIAMWKRGAFLSLEYIDVKISSFIRTHPRSTIIEAKLCGHYVNSIFASLEVKDSPYHDALLCDYEGNIAESPGANFFIVKDNTLITPPKGNILAGITRATILELADDLGIPTFERSITVRDAAAADEAFLAGTAYEILPVRSIDDHLIGAKPVGDVTRKLKALYERIVQGEERHYDKFLTFVS